MASTDYLDDLSYCPDCGQPTTRSWRTWGNAVCHSTSPKAKCKPGTAHNFCGRCGKADPGPVCEGCTNAKARWYDYEESDHEKWFWANFSIWEVPLIVLCTIPVAGILLAIHFVAFGLPLIALHPVSGLCAISAGIASYGLLREAFWLLIKGASRSVRTTVPLLPANSPDGAMPIARVVQPANVSRLTACPDCGRLISLRAASCPQCGCPRRSAP